jgi:FkbM family methyltransferase
LRAKAAWRLAGILVGDAQYQTVRFDGLTIRDFREGCLMYLKLSGELGWYRTLRRLADAAAANPVVLDVGGCVGASALPLSQVPGARVLVFEPFGKVADLLQSNLEANRATNVELHRQGLSDQPGVMDYQDGGAVEECTFSTVDAVAAGLPRVDFLKIDTDGYDLKVLSGALETVRRHKPIMVTEFVSRDLERRSGPGAQRRYADLLEELGYDAFIQAPLGRWRHKSHGQVAEEFFNSNLLLLPRGARERARALIA